jgi:hypothetical protein
MHDVPMAAVEIHSFCPRHDRHCDKAYPEYYYDAQGNLLDGETGDVRHVPNEKGQP